METTSKFEILGLHTTNEIHKKMQRGALDQLALLVEALRQEGLIQNPQKAVTQQLYLDMIGDAAHAVYAMELATGKRPLRY